MTTTPQSTAALQVAIQHPELVPEWLDLDHFASPTVRRAFEALLSAATLQDAMAEATGAAQALLRRLAVEEIPSGADLESYALEVVTSVVEAAARRVEARLIRAEDVRVSEGARLLEALRTARDPLDAGATNRAAEHLVGWIAAAGRE